jgi:hypothetical protein
MLGVMTTHHRTAGLDRLAEDLEAFAVDRDSHGKPARAAGAREAVRVLTEQDDTAAKFERVTYALGAPERWSEFTGTQAECLAELDRLGVGWLHQDRRDLAVECARAYGAIERGEVMAQVGHLRLRVVCNLQ